MSKNIVSSEWVTGRDLRFSVQVPCNWTPKFFVDSYSDFQEEQKTSRLVETSLYSECLQLLECLFYALRGLKAWPVLLLCFLTWSMLVVGHEDTGKSTENILYVSPTHLLVPWPHPLLLYRKGRVLPSFPKHSRKFKAEVLAMDGLKLSEQYVRVLHDVCWHSIG